MSQYSLIGFLKRSSARTRFRAGEKGSSFFTKTSPPSSTQHFTPSVEVVTRLHSRRSLILAAASAALPTWARPQGNGLIHFFVGRPALKLIIPSPISKS